MNKEKTRAATDASRIFKKEALGTKHTLSNVATASKNKEAAASLFFSRCQRSKVIFRVTQKSLRILLSYFRKYLALRGSDLLHSLPMVSGLGSPDNPASVLPMVALRQSCPASLRCISRWPLPLWLARLSEIAERKILQFVQCK
jgi:hypothetical protein